MEIETFEWRAAPGNVELDDGRSVPVALGDTLTGFETDEGIVFTSLVQPTKQ